MSVARAALALAVLMCVTLTASRAQALDPTLGDSRSLAHVLGDRDPSATRLRSVTMGWTAFSQTGQGYQSQAGPVLGPGSENITVIQPHLIVAIDQGKRVHHTINAPVDFVTAASPNAIDRNREPDAMSQASRQTHAATASLNTAYDVDERSQVASRGGLHLEEVFRSFHLGFGANRSFAQQTTVLAGNVMQYFDWFDRINIDGRRKGRGARATSNANAALTQILSPTTIVNLNYGVTRQSGALGNFWNSVPVSDMTRGAEYFPHRRTRHAIVGRFAQWLPWNGAAKSAYRFYADDWGLIAHSLETQLLQRLTPWWYLRATYRIHRQSGVRFYRTRVAPDDIRFRTADSDLSPLSSQTFGGQAVFDLPVSRQRMLHLSCGYDEYVRSTGLRVHVATVQSGMSF